MILELSQQQSGWTVFNLETDFPVFFPVYVYTEKARDYEVLIGISCKSFYVQDVHELNTYIELHILSFNGWEDKQL